MAASDLGGQPMPDANLAVSAPVRLYCLCKTTDENNMIGCDRCDEWYHFACVGIDQVTIHFLTYIKIGDHY
jgi:PHD-finger